MVTIGIAISLFGTLLMIPESIRLSRKNPEGVLVWSVGMSYAPYLFIAGVVLLTAGFILQLIGSLQGT